MVPLISLYRLKSLVEGFERFDPGQEVFLNILEIGSGWEMQFRIIKDHLKLEKFRERKMEC